MVATHGREGGRSSWSEVMRVRIRQTAGVERGLAWKDYILTDARQLRLMIHYPPPPPQTGVRRGQRKHYVRQNNKKHDVKETYRTICLHQELGCWRPVNERWGGGGICFSHSFVVEQWSPTFFAWLPPSVTGPPKSPPPKKTSALNKYPIQFKQHTK